MTRINSFMVSVSQRYQLLPAVKYMIEYLDTSLFRIEK